VLSFVHAADLHLDSPFVGLGEADGEVAEMLRGATFRAFENVVDLCINRSVDFLLIAGDVYDEEDRSLRAQLAFRDGLRRLADAGIHSFVVHGNHDPLEGWASSIEWPQGVHIFGGEKVESVVFERDGESAAIVHGISFARSEVKENLVRKFQAADSPLFQIGLLHCNVGSNTGHAPYAPCTLQDLARVGLDYWALGHVHARNVLSEETPTVLYPGCPQGRHVNEKGPRGCFLVQVNDRKEIRAEFVPTDAVRWECEDVDISSLGSEEDLLREMEDAISRVQERAEGRPSVCRLTLKGRGPLHAIIRRPGYTEDLLSETRAQGRSLSPIVWTESVEVQTRPSVDIEARRQSEDILGDILRLIDEYRGDPEALRRLQDALAPLYNDRHCRRYLAAPQQEELLRLLEDAEVLCVDKLLAEDEQ